MRMENGDGPRRGPEMGFAEKVLFLADKAHAVVYVALWAALLLALAALFVKGGHGGRSGELYSAEDGHLRVYSPEGMDRDVRVGRDGDLVIERIEGTCLNDAGDGKIAGASDGSDYVSYANVEGVKAGDRVVTYVVLDPDTDGEDDVLLRRDYVVDHGDADFPDDLEPTSGRDGSVE